MVPLTTVGILHIIDFHPTVKDTCMYHCSHAIETGTAMQSAWEGAR